MGVIKSYTDWKKLYEEISIPSSNSKLSLSLEFDGNTQNTIKDIDVMAMLGNNKSGEIDLNNLSDDEKEKVGGKKGGFLDLNKLGRNAGTAILNIALSKTMVGKTIPYTIPIPIVEGTDLGDATINFKIREIKAVERDKNADKSRTTKFEYTMDIDISNPNIDELLEGQDPNLTKILGVTGPLVVNYDVIKSEDSKETKLNWEILGIGINANKTINFGMGSIVCNISSS
jgi:hypothetical protein